MRVKLSLNLEDLSVDSFDTTCARMAKGTVFGEQCTCFTYCPGLTCFAATCETAPSEVGSCDETCAGTCDYTCDDRSCVCNTWDPCTTAQYTNCNGLNCL